MLPSEMRGSSQQSNMELGSLGARGTQSLNGGMGGFGGLEGAQQLGGQGQAAPVEQAPMGGSERTGFAGAMDSGAMGQEALGQGALGQGSMGEGGRLSESAVSRMNEGSLGGGGSLQGMQGAQGVQGMEGMQSMTSAFTGGQQVQGGMLSDGGGVNSLQGQGMMDGGLQSSSLQGGALQGGLQSMMGAGLAGLPAMGGGGEFGQQQMAFKKVSNNTSALKMPAYRCKNFLPPDLRQRHTYYSRSLSLIIDNNRKKRTKIINASCIEIWCPFKGL